MVSRNRIFHTATIGGQCFSGVMLDEGPCLAWGSGADVPIGVAGLRHYVKPPEFFRRKGLQPGWWMVKNHAELRMNLHFFTNADARRLSDEFGIIFMDTDFSPTARQEYFYTSPEWDGLRAWVCAHPRLACKVADDYFTGWRRRIATELDFAASSYSR